MSNKTCTHEEQVYGPGKTVVKKIPGHVHPIENRGDYSLEN